MYRLLVGFALVVTLGIVLLSSGCSSPPTGVGEVATPVVTQAMLTEATVSILEEASPTAAVTGPTPMPIAPLPPTPTTAAESDPGLEMRFSLSAREAYESAFGPAREVHTEYMLYEVIGCQNPIRRTGQHLRTDTILGGECGEWLLVFQRPAERGSYHKLSLWVAPNGIMKTEESARPVGGYGMDRRGEVSDWLIDSTDAMEIAEREGGRAFREEHPTLDVARSDSESYALVYVTLSFHPVDHRDEETEKTTEYRGSKNAIWVIKYLPMDRLKFLIDAATGEVILRSVGTGDYS